MSIFWLSEVIWAAIVFSLFGSQICCRDIDLEIGSVFFLADFLILFVNDELLLLRDICIKVL